MRAERKEYTQEEAMQLAGRCILKRMFSEKELFDRLVEKGVSEELSAYCVARFLDLRLLDDRNYAGAIVRHYSAKGYGLARVKAELKRHGIPPELFDEALEEMPESTEKIDDYIAAHLKNPDDRKEVKKVSDALIRRGWSWEEVRSAVKRYEE